MAAELRSLRTVPDRPEHGPDRPTDRPFPIPSILSTLRFLWPQAVETKVSRFPTRPSHVVWLEPEGLPPCDLVYPGGFNTSLPAEVQLAMLRTLPGLERVEMLRPGYVTEHPL